MKFHKNRNFNSFCSMLSCGSIHHQYVFGIRSSFSRPFRLSLWIVTLFDFWSTKDRPRNFHPRHSHIHTVYLPSGRPPVRLYLNQIASIRSQINCCVSWKCTKLLHLIYTYNLCAANCQLLSVCLICRLNFIYEAVFDISCVCELRKYLFTTRAKWRRSKLIYLIKRRREKPRNNGGE